MGTSFHIHPEYRDILAEANILDAASLRRYADRGEIVSEASTLCLRRHAIGNCGTYAKCYFYPGFSLRYIFRRGRARRELNSYAWFDKVGLRHPDVIAMAEQRQMGSVRWGVIMTREIPESVTLEEFFAAETDQNARRSGILRTVAKDLAGLHNAGFFHRTFRFRNILFQNNGDAEAPLYYFDCPAGHAGHGCDMHDALFDLVCLYKDIVTHCSAEEWDLMAESYCEHRDRDMRDRISSIPARTAKRFGRERAYRS